MKDSRIDHMVITVTAQEQSTRLMQALGEHEFPVTILDTMKEEVQEARTTMIAGMPRQRLSLFFQLVRQHGAPERPLPRGPNCRARLAACIEMDDVIEVRTGCATSYVVPVREYLRM